MCEDCLNLKQRQNRLPSAIGAMVLALCLMTTCACSKSERPAPLTFPVTGEVVVTRSRLPVGGFVEFKPSQNEEFTAMGLIEEQGKFSLKIPFVDRSLPGATEGPHKVRVLLPPFGEGWHGGDVAVEGTFTVKPSENHFTIKLP